MEELSAHFQVHGTPSPNEQEISPTKYPIRTLSTYILEGDNFSGYGVSLTGDETRAILFADG